jgi:hypothetical protein
MYHAAVPYGDAARTAAGATRSSYAPIKVLLVDDYTVVRSGLSKFPWSTKTSSGGYEASDGAEAIQNGFAA